MKAVLTCVNLIFFSIQVCIAADGIGIRDTVVGKEVIVSEVKMHQDSIGTESILIMLDASSKQGKRLADILNENTEVYVKSYGVGQLASITINGSSASQTQLLWNGIKINSPTTGQGDLSLFDLGTINDVAIRSQPSSASLGGEVNLLTTLNQNKAFLSQVLFRYGSYQTAALSNITQFKIGKWLSSTRFNHLSSQNDFTYRNTTKINDPQERLKNAATKQLSMLQILEYQINANHQISANIWFIAADRQLPSTIASTSSGQHQYDQSIRSMLSYHYKRSAYYFSIQSAYINDQLHYTNADAKIDSRYTVQASRNAISLNKTIGRKWEFKSSINEDYEHALSTGFATAKQRNLVAINLMAIYNFGQNYSAGLGIKQEMLGFTLLPFSPSAFMTLAKQRHKNKLLATLSVARAYRVPTLNDLYWAEGGNPNLRPEKGYTSGLLLQYHYSSWLSTGVNLFCNYVTDWILWHPISSGIWRPDNVKEVWSRGATIHTAMQTPRDINTSGWLLIGRCSYTYTATTSLTTVSASDNSKGKQLIYVPIHKLNLSAQFQYRHYYLRGIYTLVGERYTTTDNSQSLPSYSLIDLEIGKDLRINQQVFGLSIRANNIANTDYQVVAQRPMMGRSYEITVRLNLSK